MGSKIISEDVVVFVSLNFTANPACRIIRLRPGDPWLVSHTPKNHSVINDSIKLSALTETPLQGGSHRHPLQPPKK